MNTTDSHRAPKYNLSELVYAAAINRALGADPNDPGGARLLAAARSHDEATEPYYIGEATYAKPDRCPKCGEEMAHDAGGDPGTGERDPGPSSHCWDCD